VLPPGLNKPSSREPITYSKLLIVEGYDPFEFFLAFIRYLGLSNQVEIRNFGGIAELPPYLRTLTATPGFDRVTSLGIVRDAEIDALTAFASVRESLAQANLTAPHAPNEVADGTPSVSVFILPDNANPGSLESLCLQSVSDDPALPCIEEYFACIQNQGLPLPANMAKAKVQAFLSSRQTHVIWLGMASHRNHWPWDSPVFDSTKGFLRAL
jgi:hypothetical protein